MGANWDACTDAALGDIKQEGILGVAAFLVKGKGVSVATMGLSSGLACTLGVYDYNR